MLLFMVVILSGSHCGAKFNTGSLTRAAGSLRPETDGAPDAEHDDETAQGDSEVRAEADEDDALHLWSLLRHLHAGRRRQDGQHNSVLQPYN